MNDEMWRNLINGLEQLPEEGKGAPTMENIKPEPILDGEAPVVLQKIVTEVYTYTSLDGEKSWFGTNTFQDIQVLGKMRLSEAQKMIQAAKTRRRRKK